MATATLQRYGGGGNLNIGSMLTDAPNCRDGSVDDSSTFHSVAQASFSPGMCAYWDLGSAQSVDQVRATYSSDADLTRAAELRSSPDGSTWTLRQGLNNPAALGAFTSDNRSFASVSARYWRLAVTGTTSDALISYTTRVSDFRLYLAGDEYVIGGTGRLVKVMTPMGAPFPFRHVQF